MTDKPRRTNPGTEISQQIDRYRTSITTVLPSHIDPAMFVRVAQGVVRRDTKLADAAQRNLPSFMSALMECARLGLEPGETYYLIPFEDKRHGTVEIEGVISWQGEVELIYRAGAVGSVIAEVVYSSDEFSYHPGRNPYPDHKPEWFGDRGQLVGVYAYAVMLNGATSKVIVMGRKEIDKVKAEARGTDRADSPWTKWEDEMWLKSAVHKLYDWVPSSPEFMTELLRARAAATPAVGGVVTRTVATPTLGEGHTPDDHQQITDDELAALEAAHDIDWVEEVDPETGEIIRARAEQIEVDA